MNELTQERVRELLWYDPETGVLTWRERINSIGRRFPWSSKPAGRINPRGYVVVRIGHKVYRAHRVIWLGMTGELPPEVDHKDDLNKSNNRWTNLRAATSSKNQMNTVPRSDNASGYKGVHWDNTSKKWKAQLGHEGKRHSLGYFSTAEEAYVAYCNAARIYFREFARL